MELRLQKTPADGMEMCWLAKIGKLGGASVESHVMGEGLDDVFLNRVNWVMGRIDTLLTKGNRICLLIDSKVMALVPMRVLYLTQFLDYSFTEAVTALDRQNKLNDLSYSIAKDIFEMVQERRSRGRITI